MPYFDPYFLIKIFPIKTRLLKTTGDLFGVMICNKHLENVTISLISPCRLLSVYTQAVYKAYRIRHKLKCYFFFSWKYINTSIMSCIETSDDWLTDWQPLICIQIKKRKNEQTNKTRAILEHIQCQKINLHVISFWNNKMNKVTEQRIDWF